MKIAVLVVKILVFLRFSLTLYLKVVFSLGFHIFFEIFLVFLGFLGFWDLRNMESQPWDGEILSQKPEKKPKNPKNQKNTKKPKNKKKISKTV